MSNNQHERKAAEMEKTMDEVYSKLGQAYGISKADIARLAVKRYGGDDMNERTEEVLANARGMLSGGRKDAMERMMEWEMVKGLRRDNDARQMVTAQPPPQNLQQQPNMGMPTMQEMFMMMMMPQMMKAMSGGDDDMMKMYKMHQMQQLMGDNDGKGANIEKLMEMFRQEQAEAEARSQQLMSQMFGRQEAEKMQAAKELREREIDQRLQRAEYMARHPTQPQQVIPSAMDRMDEGLNMLSETKSRMEGLGMVSTPPKAEDKQFELDKMGISHKQGVETQAVQSMARSAEKMSDTADHTLNKVIDFMAKEQEVKATQVKMQTPEGQLQMQKQYEQLADQVIEEQQVVEPEGARSDLEFGEEDDLDAND